MKRIISLLALMVIVSCPAWAGDKAAKSATATPAADPMMNEMMKCSVCKNLAVHMDVLGPVMSSEVITMSNGMALMHTISDAKKVPVFHAACKEMTKAGEACMTMTEEQAKTDLCMFCQEIRSVGKAGATISSGETPTGGMLVISSADPAVKTKIAALETKCESMMAKK